LERIDPRPINAAPLGFARAESGLLSSLQLLTALLLLVLSPLGLLQFGWQYADTGGSPLEKFHPSTFLAAAGVFVAAMAGGNPVSGLLALLARHGRLVPYFAANVVLIVYTSMVLRLPVTLFIETFIGAGLVLLLFQQGDERTARRVALLIHGLLVVNALVGFFEAATQTRLTPLVINGELLTSEPRSTALLGHPLSNAMVMACYTVVLALGGGRDLPRALRPVVFLIALASLVPFGGRAATAVCLLSLAGIAAMKLWQVLRGGRFDTRTVIGVLVAGPLAALGLLVAFEVGLFDTLTNRLFDDEGSAGTRIEMFELFRYLTFNDWLFGPDPGALDTWVRMHGLEYGIESFVVAFVLNYGLVMTVVFFPAFALFLREVIAVSRPGAWLVVVGYLLIALTSISLSTKSPTQSVFVMILTVLMRRDQGDDFAAAQAGPVSRPMASRRAAP
jgi:hypothetical protein